MGGIASSLGGLVGGIIQGKSAKTAQKAQVAAAEQNRVVAQDTAEQTLDLFQPFVDQGSDYGNALAYELLGGEAPTIGGSSNFQVVDANGNVVFTGDTDRDARQFLEAERDTYGAQRSAAYTSPQNIRPSDFYDERNDGRSNYLNAVRASTDNALKQLGPDPYQYQVQENVTDAGRQYQGFELSNDYQFARDQGLEALDRQFAARGQFNSGALEKARAEYASGLASQGRSEYLNRLAGGQGLGYNATQSQANALSNLNNSLTNVNNNIGNAKSAGAIAQGNAFAGAVSSGFETIGGIAGAFGGGGGGGITDILGQAGEIFGRNKSGQSSFTGLGVY